MRVCMCECVCVVPGVCMNMCIGVCVLMCVCVHICGCVCLCVYICILIYYVQAYIWCVCVYKHACICVCVPTSMCMHVYSKALYTILTSETCTYAGTYVACVHACWSHAVYTQCSHGHLSKPKSNTNTSCNERFEHDIV